MANRLAITVGLALAAIGVGAASASAATFSNTATIAIPVSGNAAPYPSQITVSGQTAPITDLNVSLNDFSHTASIELNEVQEQRRQIRRQQRQIDWLMERVGRD